MTTDVLYLMFLIGGYNFMISLWANTFTDLCVQQWLSFHCYGELKWSIKRRWVQLIEVHSWLLLNIWGFGFIFFISFHCVLVFGFSIPCLYFCFSLYLQSAASLVQLIDDFRDRFKPNGIQTHLAMANNTFFSFYVFAQYK